MKLTPPSRTASFRYFPRASDTALTTSLSPLGFTAFLALACLAALMTPWQASAQKKPNGEWFIVPGEITSEVYHTVRNDTERAIKRGVTTIVYEFQSRELSEFGPCYDLANFLLTKIQGQVQTYAVVDSPINGHAVLPVMACRTVYMTKQGSLGFDQRAVEKAGLINATTANAYVTIGDNRSRPPALLIKMLKPELTVYAYDNQQGRQIRLDKTQTDDFNLGIDAKFTVGAEDRRFQPQVLLAGGAHGVYTPEFAERNNLVNRSYPSKNEVVNAIGVPVGRTPLPDRPRAAVIEITGEADNGTYEMVQEKIRRAIAEEVHCIIFYLDNAAGGADSVSGASQVANYLNEQAREVKRIKTVAFIPENCTGSANVIAIACDEIVLGPQGKLGDVSTLVYKAPNQPFEENDVTVRVENLKAIAKKSGFPEILVLGMFRRDLEIVQAQEKPDPNRAQQNLAVQLLDKREVGPNMVILDGPPVKKRGELLVLSGQRAVELGAARNVLQTREIQGVYTMYGILDGDVTVMRASWLDNLVFFLKHPATTVLLVIIGFTCLILEFKAPGTTVPAILAAICFLLLFWAHSWLAGQVNALAILLFLLGIVLLGVEVFVLPGFGVTGVSGIVLMLLGLSLLVVRQWPQTTDEYLILGRNFGIFAGGLIFSVIGAFAVARYLPHIPYANRLMLPAPDEETSDAAATLPPASSPSLLGAVGTAVTELRPAGRACFGDEYIDVTSESGYVEPGRRVQIIEIDGLRVVVKPV